MSETSKQVVAAYAKLHEYCTEKSIEYLVFREEKGELSKVLDSGWYVSIGIMGDVMRHDLHRSDVSGKVLSEVVDNVIKKYDILKGLK